MNACSVYLILVIAAVIEAGPTARAIRDKSLERESKAETAKENLKIEETGEERDRSKKAAVCLQLEPQENQLAAVTIPHQMPLSLIQPQASFVVPQQMGQQQMMMPQPAVQPIHTIQVVQPAPAQPCASSINVIQSQPESNAAGGNGQTPRPRPTPSPEVEIITEKPTPMRMEKPLPPPRESYAILPVMPYQYQQPMVAMSDAYIDPTMHGLGCTCRQVQPMSMTSVMPYTSAYARSSMPFMRPIMLPSRARAQVPQPRSKTYINVNLPPGFQGYGNQRPQHVQQTVNQEMYLNGVDFNSYGTPAFSMGALPRSYRSSQSDYPVPVNSLSAHDYLDNESLSEADDLVAGNKSPREIAPSQLSPELIKRKEEEDHAGVTVTDGGKRSARSEERETTLRSER